MKNYLRVMLGKGHQYADECYQGAEGKGRGGGGRAAEQARGDGKEGEGDS